MLKRFCWSILLLTCGLLRADCQQILDYIFENLPEYGTLLQDKEGLVYVDIPNDYIYKLFPLINQKDFVQPPYFGRLGSHGAHISVIYAKEATANNIRIKDLGQTVYFNPKVCQVVKPSTMKAIEEVYIVTVEAPALHKLRKRYGLGPPAHPFHITIGVKYSNLEQEDGVLSLRTSQ